MVNAISTDLAEQIEQARQRGVEESIAEPRAVKAWYNIDTEKVCIELKTGVEIRVPVRFLQGLEEGTPEQLEKVELVGGGFGLHWESLDADLTVPGIVAGIYGTQNWMFIGFSHPQINTSQINDPRIEGGKLIGI